MISKKNRLTERMVKKVLTRWKPFFSYWVVLNYIKNKKDINRFAVVIWSKSVKTNVDRNFFRRRFYNTVNNKLDNKEGIDYVFVVKKQTKLDKKEQKSIKSFDQDINFLLNKI